MKKLVAILLVLLLTLTTFATAFAQEQLVVDESTLNSRVTATPEAEAANDKLAKVKEKEMKKVLAEIIKKEKEQIRSKGEVTALGSTYYNVNTPVCPQETTYWCGPASVQAVLQPHYIYQTQADIAARSGTDQSGSNSVNLANTANYYIGGSWYYVAVDVTTKSSLYEKLKTDMYLGWAPIPLFKTEYLDYYGGRAYRHYSPTRDFAAAYYGSDPSAYDYNNSSVTLSDVHYNPSYGGIHTVSFNDLYNAVNAAYGANKNFIY